MSPKKSTVKFGAPTAELPGSKLPAPRVAEHWHTAAAHVRENPGAWIPVTVGHLTADRHCQAASDIRSGKIHSFREPGFDARFRAGVLYVRYDAPAAANVRKIGA